MLEIPRPSRICSVTNRELQPGEVFFSVLIEEKDHVKRLDIAAESWTGPPPEFLGWWKTRVPSNNDKKIQIAPNDILLNLFEQLALQPDNTDMRYVLALLLIRRRQFRYEREEEDEKGQKKLVVYAIKENITHEIPITVLDRKRIDEVQKQLSLLIVN
jgi:DNA-directed RNA polymerase subunit K/omega